MYIKIADHSPRIQAMIIQSRSALCAQLRDVDPGFNSISPVGLGMDVGMSTGKKSKTKEKMHWKRKVAEDPEIVLEALNLRLEDGNCNHSRERSWRKVKREERNSTGRLAVSAKGPEMEEGVSCGL